MLKTHPVVAAEKENLHPRNLHRGRYDFKILLKTAPELSNFIKINKFGSETIDFSDSQAVLALNKAVLQHYYEIKEWNFPKGFLCPPIPGRADYIHYAADLLSSTNGGKIPDGNKIKVLDIGMGANCVYPLLGSRIYAWNFIGTDIDPVSIESARRIISSNGLDQKIQCRHQIVSSHTFKGIFDKDEKFDLTICNPPFHVSAEKAQAGSMLKWKNLGIAKHKSEVLNFGGQNAELWCPGGEAAFITRMISESKAFGTNCCWFTSLVSKKENLPQLYNALERVGARAVKTIDMAQGQKVSRVLAWSFFTKPEVDYWKTARW